MVAAFILLVALSILGFGWWLGQRQARQRRSAKLRNANCLSMRDTLERRVRDGNSPL